MEKPQGPALDYSVALVVEDEPLVRVFATKILRMRDTACSRRATHKTRSQFLKSAKTFLSS